MAELPLFAEPRNDGDSIELSEIESLCTNCEQNSLGRLVVKADSAVVKIPELDFEIPPNTQRGVITTVEGVLSRSINDLLKEQPNRKETDPDLAAKLEEFIAKLQGCLSCTSPFSIVLDDPSGNSFIENPLAPDVDPLLTVDKYNRTSQQEIQLGIITNSTEKQTTTASSCNNEESKDGDEAATEDEVMTFHTNCSHCNSPADTRMKLVDIPHFKEVIIMATTCDYCGWKTNEVKSGAGISETGIRINLKLTDPSDLNRDVLKAETASIAIPELDFLLESGTLGGRFSTIEGLLQQIKEQLKRAHPFSVGDSSTSSKLSAFINKLDKVIEGKSLSIHIIMDDPAGNSYIQNVFAPDEDPEMSVEHYERTSEQNELLGLNDMNTEHYLKS